MTFENRTVLITGAAGHLGRAVATGFAGRGARLVLAGRDRASLAEAFGDASAHRFVVADLLHAEAIGRAIGEVVDEAGGIDVLCHLAGGFRMGEAVHETSDATWSAMFDVNARAFVNVARAVVPPMIRRRGGRIVTVGAHSAQQGRAGMGAYVASKSALVRLTESLSAELKEHGINVNCVLPGVLDTPPNRAAMPQADPARWVAPEALAEVIMFLASDAARAVHGAAVPVTGFA